MAALIAIVEGWLGPKFAGFAKPLIYLVVALLLALAVWGAFKLHDRKVIATHDAHQEAVTAKADKQADNHAADQRVMDVSRQIDEKTQTQEAINEAHRTGADPRAAYYQCVRAQQSARAAGKPSPKC